MAYKSDSVFIDSPSITGYANKYYDDATNGDEIGYRWNKMPMGGRYAGSFPGLNAGGYQNEYAKWDNIGLDFGNATNSDGNLVQHWAMPQHGGYMGSIAFKHPSMLSIFAENSCIPLCDEQRSDYGETWSEVCWPGRNLGYESGTSGGTTGDASSLGSWPDLVESPLHCCMQYHRWETNTYGTDHSDPETWIAIPILDRMGDFDGDPAWDDPESYRLTNHNTENHHYELTNSGKEYNKFTCWKIHPYWNQDVEAAGTVNNGSDQPNAGHWSDWNTDDVLDFYNGNHYPLTKYHNFSHKINRQFELPVHYDNPNYPKVISINTNNYTPNPDVTGIATLSVYDPHEQGLTDFSHYEQCLFSNNNYHTKFRYVANPGETGVEEILVRAQDSSGLYSNVMKIRINVVDFIPEDDVVEGSPSSVILPGEAFDKKFNASILDSLSGIPLTSETLSTDTTDLNQNPISNPDNHYSSYPLIFQFKINDIGSIFSEETPLCGGPYWNNQNTPDISVDSYPEFTTAPPLDWTSYSDSNLAVTTPDVASCIQVTWNSLFDWSYLNSEISSLGQSSLFNQFDSTLPEDQVNRFLGAPLFRQRIEITEGESVPLSSTTTTMETLVENWNDIFESKQWKAFLKYILVSNKRNFYDEKSYLYSIFPLQLFSGC